MPSFLSFVKSPGETTRSMFDLSRLLKRLDFSEMKFSLYFLVKIFSDTSTAPTDPTATIELTHNWGTESDPEFKGGNSEPREFGHTGVTVDDVHKACERFEQLEVEFVKKPNDGKMKNIAFIKDPDGYWIEIFNLKSIGTTTGNAA
ncbi:unnamed protein product [Brassica oleracea]|uniref:Lactoylglutathione lyase n=1 Tax=Brassica napus TaxID=3708 RepID=A0A816LJW0_BRANA|nr:unnamed protein product [Brassica napus]